MTSKRRFEMGGTNPYMNEPKTKKPENKYRIKFENLNKVIEVDPTRIPYSETGLAGSILDIAMAEGVELDHACGGVCACSTCHIYVKEGLESCSLAAEEELDMMDMAPGLKPISRLACQCVPDGTRDITIEIPNWNRNLAREGK
jgi:2Fe-2S ferredoxin